jgi:hypothetical protein
MNITLTDMEKAFMIWAKQEVNQTIPFIQSLLWSKAQTHFNSMKVEKGEEAMEEKVKGSRGCLMGLKVKSCLHDLKVQG